VVDIRPCSSTRSTTSFHCVCQTRLSTLELVDVPKFRVDQVTVQIHNHVKHTIDAKITLSIFVISGLSTLILLLSCSPLFARGNYDACLLHGALYISVSGIRSLTNPHFGPRGMNRSLHD